MRRTKKGNMTYFNETDKKENMIYFYEIKIVLNDKK